MIDKLKKTLKKITLINSLYSYYKYTKTDFYKFRSKITKKTWKTHKNIIKWANECLKNLNILESEVRFLESEDPVVREGYQLREKAKKKFYNKLTGNKKIKILMHVPSQEHSPGGFSLFNNLIQAINFIGIPCRALGWNENINMHLKTFGPSVFITSDFGDYLERIDWKAVDNYRAQNIFYLGLTASLEEYGNSPLLQRLKAAEENKVNFYYSYFAPDYINSRKEYKAFFENGYKILSIEFGANPLIYYPVPEARRDFDFVFLGSINKSKWPRYIEYFYGIFTGYSGLIHGPGWFKTGDKRMITDRDRYFYSRARVGLNLHTPEEIKWGRELNERTYMLAACGIPQLVDNPPLIYKKFPEDSVFIASGAKEYNNLFSEILNDRKEAQKRALNAQKIIFNGHTSFHRAEKFISDLIELFPVLK